jgi:hypothetical protein
MTQFACRTEDDLKALQSVGQIIGIASRTARSSVRINRSKDLNHAESLLIDPSLFYCAIQSSIDRVP